LVVSFGWYEIFFVFRWFNAQNLATLQVKTSLFQQIRLLFFGFFGFVEKKTFLIEPK